MMLIDSHCHLNYPELLEDQANVLTRARCAGVGGFLNISTKQVEWSAVIRTAEREKNVWAAIGIHPHEADAHPDVTSETLVELAQHPKVIAFGETGLDYFYEHSERNRQKELFRQHITAARQLNMPVIIHTRDAEQDTTALLQEELEQGPFSAVLHCFTGTARFAEQMLDLGFFISFSGIVTFKNAKELQAVAAAIPADRLLIETDSPFLAPVPFRGKVCEPAYVSATCSFVAALRGETPEQVAAQTTQNFFRLFRKAAV